jgi:hypothetical protein
MKPTLTHEEWDLRGVNFEQRLGIITKLFVPKVKRNGFPFLPDFKIRS